MEEIARKLCRNGFRPWFERWSLILSAQCETRLALAGSTSRVVLWIIGAAGLSYWSRENLREYELLESIAIITVLAPGFPDSSAMPYHHISRCVIDMRKGLDDDIAWDQLKSSITLSSRQIETIIDPNARLGPEILKRNTINSYNQIAEKFASRWFEHPPESALEKLLRRLPGKACVLDAGCGPGHHAKLIARSGHDVVGVDLSEKMLQIASKSVESVHFERMDIQALGFPSNMFNAIWCAAAALHTPREEIVQLLRGFRRVLKSDGLLGLNLQIGRKSEVVDYGADHRFFEYYRDSSEIAMFLRLAGFSVEAYDYGETTRNTHGLDIKLKWTTLYARPRKDNEPTRSVATVLPAS